jgi:hypothetical protein
MFDSGMDPDGERPNTTPNPVLAARYNRLALETSGMVRRIMWRLADEAQATQRRPAMYADAIDLHVMPEAADKSHDAVVTWA